MGTRRKRQLSPRLMRLAHGTNGYNWWKGSFLEDFGGSGVLGLESWVRVDGPASGVRERDFFLVESVTWKIDNSCRKSRRQT